MADVTDVAFRELFARHGPPDVFWTEFVSVDGLVSPIGREKLAIDLAKTPQQRPIVAQIFGSTPEHFHQIAGYLRELGFDGIDINMGCPEKSINRKQCAGAELINHPALAQEIILATTEGSGGLPVSVKTRSGYRQDDLEHWLPTLLATHPAAITIHARTKKDMSKVPARWELIAQAVELARGSGTLIIGNGDVTSLADGQQKAAESGADGVMVGRGVFGNPWFFQPTVDRDALPVAERLAVLVEHARLYEQWLGPHKPFDLMKKHFKAYVHGWPGAAELRAELMQTRTADEVAAVVARVQGG